MQISISGNHLEITPAINSYAQEKAAKLDRYHGRLSSLEMILRGVDNHTYEIELLAHVEGQKTPVVHFRHEDLYHGIVEAVNKMERVLTDLKERAGSYH